MYVLTKEEITRIIKNRKLLYVISDFCRAVDENWVLFDYYAASSRNFWPTLRDNLSVPPWRSSRNNREQRGFHEITRVVSLLRHTTDTTHKYLYILYNFDFLIKDRVCFLLLSYYFANLIFCVQINSLCALSSYPVCVRTCAQLGGNTVGRWKAFI